MPSLTSRASTRQLLIFRLPNAKRVADDLAFANRVESVVVRLVELNATNGIRDTRCRMAAATRGPRAEVVSHDPLTSVVIASFAILALPHLAHPHTACELS